MKDDHVIKGSSDYSESEGFHQSEQCQETEVRRMAVALPVQQPQDDEGPKEGHIEGPYAVAASMGVERRARESTYWVWTQRTVELDLDRIPPTIVVAS